MYSIVTSKGVKMKHYLVAAVVALATSVAPTWAAEEKEKEVPANEVGFRFFRGNAEVRGYFEKALSDEVAVFLNLVKSNGFEYATIGPAYYITPTMEIGVSMGRARYASDDEDEKSSHGVMSAFWYWETDTLKTEVTVEKYRNDPNPWYYYGYAQMPFATDFAAGIYTDSEYGTGFTLAWTFSKNIEVRAVWFAKERGDSRAMLGITAGF